MKVTLLALATFVSLTLAKAPIRNPDAQDVVADSYVVVYKASTNLSERTTHESRVNTKARRRSKRGVGQKYNAGFNGYQVDIAAADLDDLRNDPIVDFVAKDQVLSISATIPATDRQSAVEKREYIEKKGLVSQKNATWGLGRISHKNKGSTTYVADSTYGSGVKVYVIDSGILTTHAEFEGRAVWGANFITGSPDVDENGHGTHCAGTIAGKTFGVAKKASVIAVKVLNGDARGPLSSVLGGMQWAYDNAGPTGRKKAVVNLSIQATVVFDVANAMAKAMADAGMTVVVAAGNDNADASGFSFGSEPSALTVAASDIHDVRASFSNFGSVVDIFAPGVDVLSAWIGSNTATRMLSGTSMATPHVAGLAAYYIKLYSLSGSSVASKIISTATKNKITDAQGSPNRIAYNNNNQESSYGR